MPIPPQAKKVFTGEIFNVYQWPQKMFDGTEEIFEYLTRPNAIVVIPTMDNKIIMIDEQSPIDHWPATLVGGQIEPGEDALVGAKRELQEETGLISSDWEMYKIFSFGSKIDATITCFIARNCQQTNKTNLDPGEKITLLPIDFDTFIEHACFGASFRAKDLTTDILRLRVKGGLEQFKKLIFSPKNAT